MVYLQITCIMLNHFHFARVVIIEKFGFILSAEVKSLRYWVNGTAEFTSDTGKSETADVEAGFEERIQSNYLSQLQLETLVHLVVLTDNIAARRRKRHLVLSDHDYLSRDRRSASRRFVVHFTLEGPEE